MTNTVMNALVSIYCVIVDLMQRDRMNMAFVSKAILYCVVVLNDVMQRDADCGHNNIQI